jgi:excisionase family DNA binding protein
MTPGVPYGEGTRMLELAELCEWLNIKTRHARKLVERDAIPYRKVGRLLRFPEAEVERWSRPKPHGRREVTAGQAGSVSAMPRRPRSRVVLPKSLIEQEDAGHGQRQSA